MSGVDFLDKLLNSAVVEWKSLGDERFFEIANLVEESTKLIAGLGGGQFKRRITF